MKIVCAVILFLILIAGCSSDSEYLPQNIYNLSLTEKLTGKVAADFLNRLHIQNVTDVRSEIGFYKGTPGDAIIYLSYYSDSDEAVKYERQMTDKISSGNTPFIMGEYLNIEGKQVYRTFGMGQTHFVFSHDNVLVWLSLGTKWANDFLIEYESYIR